MASVKVIEDQGKRAVFEVSDVHLAVVNSLRRILLAEVPAVAPNFEAPDRPSDIHIKANSSAMHNEMLSHRISLVPIHLPSMERVLEYDDDYTFEIKVKNAGMDNLLVTSKDIVVKDRKSGKDVDASALFPPDPITGDHVVITLLKPNLKDPDNGEEVDVTYSARRGLGRHHARWCPVSTCALTLVEDDAEVAKRRKELSKDASKNYFETITRARCVSVGEDGQPNRFKFVVESECAIPARRLFAEALEVLIRKLETLSSKQLEDVRRDSDAMYTLTIDDEDHTLGNLLQALIYERRKDLGCEFVGYHVPHPLKRSVVLTVTLDEDVSFPLFFDRSVQSILATVRDLRDKWAAIKK